jgi:DNA repair protein RadA/Sms
MKFRNSSFIDRNLRKIFPVFTFFSIIIPMYTCNNCSHSQLKWTGKCPKCGTWNTLAEEKVPERKVGKIQESGQAKIVTGLLDRTSRETPRYPIRSQELSNVLGGGIVPGSFILLSGEPGI